MLRPSLIRVLMAGTPSLVAGTLTNRFGCAMRVCSMRASRTVVSVSWARAGETSRET
jgi:hypothetical protein